MTAGRFPGNAKRYRCPDCGRLVVIQDGLASFVVSHASPQCPEFSAFIQSLKPDRTTVEAMILPDAWKPS